MFENNRQQQYTNAVTFSTLFDLMSAVVIGSRNSVHDAFQASEEKVGVSAAALYEKLKNIETCTSQALVRETAAEMASLIDQMDGTLPPLAPGYSIRILDGNCIAAAHHRIKELRHTAAGALPGKSLVVLDPQHRLMMDVFPCQDGHAQERAILDQVVPTIAKSQLWIEDRNFCTFGFLWAIHDRDAFFITRQHGNMNFQPLSERQKVGKIDSGTVYEQSVLVRGEGNPKGTVTNPLASAESDAMN